eukprot:365756-Chlamydomonas_euryale.AAC.24
MSVLQAHAGCRRVARVRWRDQYGNEARHLRKVAMKALRLRNRLTPALARKLVSVHNNLRLLGNVTADDYEAVTRYPVWQDGGEEEEMVLEVGQGKAGQQEASSTASEVVAASHGPQPSQVAKLERPEDV